MISVPGSAWANAVSGREVDLLFGELVVDVRVGEAPTPQEQGSRHDEHDDDDETAGAHQIVENPAPRGRALLS